MKFTVEYLEVFLLVMVRISAMVYIMPFFGDRSIPVKVKIAISFFLAVLVGNTVDYNAVSYTGVIGYSILCCKRSNHRSADRHGSKFIIIYIGFFRTYVEFRAWIVYGY